MVSDVGSAWVSAWRSDGGSVAASASVSDG